MEDHSPQEMERESRSRALAEELNRFPAALFEFDPRMRDGWLSDRYFLRTANALRHARREPQVRVQVFAKKAGIVAGLYEAIRMLQTQLAPGYDFRDLEVESLIEGDAIAPWETTLLISGPYRAFAHLETPLLGVLARRSLVATNVRATVEAANGKPVVFMAPRHDDWRVQAADGYAAYLGGAHSVSSTAGGAWWGAHGVGTMPHSMIAAFDGDVVQATLAFVRYVREQEPDVPVVSLVDYRNHVVSDSLAVAGAVREEFGDHVLSAVRVDTSEKLIDESLIGDPAVWGVETLTGVNAPLIRKLRAALDSEGFDYVGIVVSGGFNPVKIRRFEEEGVPVSAYGVGSSLLGHGGSEHGLLNNFDFTADVVEVNGRAESKVGRRFRPNSRLARVDWALVEPAEPGSG